MVNPDTVIIAQQPKQKPFLFLPDAQRLLVPANQSSWQTIAQPAPGTTKNFDIFRMKTDLLEKLSVHCIFRRFPVIDTTLGKLPGVLPDAPRPQ